MKKALAVLLLVAIVFTTALASCSKEASSGEESSDSNLIETQIPEGTGADISTVQPIPEVPNAEDSMTITGEELLTLIRNGTIAKNGDYAITDGNYLTFARADDGKTYDLKNAIIRVGVRDGEAGVSLGNARNITLKNAKIAAYGGTAIDTSKARGATLSKIHATGNAEIGFSVNGNEITLDGCTVASLDDGKVETAIVALGSDITITNCNIKGAGIGICDKSENGTIIENNVLTDCGTGVLCETSNSTVWYNTVKGGTVGIKAVDDKSEISAGESTVYNTLAAMNDVSGAKTSVVFENVSNGVILLNTLESVSVSGCTNIYVNENSVNGTLNLNKNNYMLANGNICGKIEVSNNENINGDNVTDLSKRLAVGANEELLPHINKEQFVGMTRKSVVRTATSANDLKSYLFNEMKNKKLVIVPPGAYVNVSMVMNNYSDVTVYAYGVLSEMYESNRSEDQWEMNNCSNVTLKGMFFSTSIYPFTQGTVSNKWTESGSSCVGFIADPGYHEDFTSGTGNFNSNTAGHYFKSGEIASTSDITSYTSNSYNATTKLNTLKGLSAPVYQGISKGDRVAFRSGREARCLDMHSCTLMKFEDVTVHSAAGFAERDGESNVAPVMHRFAVMAGPAPVLDSDKKYDDPNGVIWTDSYGRKRSASPLYATGDATHCTNSRTGIQVISCLFENMNDDGGNVNAHYSVLQTYNSSTKTITYTKTNVRNYQIFGPNFKVGDTVLLYTMSGKYVGTAKTTTATAVISEDTRSIVLDTNVNIPSGEKIVVQNASATGKDFLYDNVVVRNSHANGIRGKSPSGEIKNCTFDNIRASGVKCTPEYNEWPECGYSTNLKIINNVFEGLGRADSVWEDWNNRAGCAPLVIRVNEADSIPTSLTGKTNPKSSYSSDMAYCMHKNIEVSGNVFKDRYCRYEISLSGVTDLRITNNTFEAANTSASTTSTKAPVLILTGNGIELSNNAYKNGSTTPIENRRNIGLNITGNDIS